MNTVTQRKRARWRVDWGLARGIERHNFLIYRINRRRAERFVYRGRVVDLGCGEAPYRETILATASEYIGVDWPHSMHDSSDVDVVADLTQPLPFADDYADTVVAFQVLEHLPNPHAVVQECHRILRPGGVLHLTVPFMWHAHEEPHDYFRFTQHGLRYLLEQAGFAEVQIEAETGFWQMWLLKLNYHLDACTPRPWRLLWYPFWWLTQLVAPWLDCRRGPDAARETTHYAVTAYKAAPDTEMQRPA